MLTMMHERVVDPHTNAGRDCGHNRSCATAQLSLLGIAA
jgi:hypothetical protein